MSDFTDAINRRMYAELVGRQLTCPYTGKVLDARTAVVIEVIATDKVLIIMSPEAWAAGEKEMPADLRATVRVVIGGKVQPMTTELPDIPVHTEDADLTDPRTTFAAWDGRDHIICNDGWAVEADNKCDGTREHALQHAADYVRDNPELAAGVYVFAFTPAEPGNEDEPDV